MSRADGLLCAVFRFNVYVSQPEVKPGCVLRRANVNVLEQRKLVNPNEVSLVRITWIAGLICSSAGRGGC
jgi:hypothetical protein